MIEANRFISTYHHSTDIHTRAHTCMHTNAHTHAHKHAYTHMYTHAHAHHMLVSRASRIILMMEVGRGRYCDWINRHRHTHGEKH